MPEMKNSKHPSPHMINIPWIISTCDLSTLASNTHWTFCKLLPWHQSLGLTQPEEQQLQSFHTKADVSESPWEDSTFPVVPRAVTPQTAVLFPLKVLKRDHVAEKVPASARFQKGFEQQHLAFETLSPGTSAPQCMCHLPCPRNRINGNSPPAGTFLWPSHLRSCEMFEIPVSHNTEVMKLLVCTPWAPEFRSSWHNARIIFFFKSGMLNSVLEEFAS